MTPGKHGVRRVIVQTRAAADLQAAIECRNRGRLFAQKYGEQDKVANSFFGDHSLSAKHAKALEEEIATTTPAQSLPPLARRIRRRRAVENPAIQEHADVIAEADVQPLHRKIYKLDSGVR